MNTNKEGCVKSVLASRGQYIKRLSFPDYAPTPSKLVALLRHCKDLVELRIPTRKLSSHQLEEAIQPLGKLQHLDIPWTSDVHSLLVICDRLNELTIRVELSKYQLNPLISPLNSWLDKWAIKGFLPQTLNFVMGQNIPLTTFVKHWQHLNPHSPTGHTDCLKVFSNLKVPMDLYPPLPDFQLQFGESCTLPFVEPSKFGLLGLEKWDVLLTDSSYHGKVLHKAVVIQLRHIRCSLFSNDFTGLSFVTHFDVSFCMSLHSGHLEQLAMACPNLQHLNLQDKRHCLERLQGLHTLCACRKLRGLNLLGISEVECCVQLWKILVDMRLSYLAIELCVLTPWGDNKQINQEIIRLLQECSTLQALEIHCGFSLSNSRRKRNLSVLSNFPSLVYCLVGNSYSDSPVCIKLVVNSCAKLKYLSCHSAFLSDSLAQNINLEQLYLYRTSNDTDLCTFMQSISDHGGLVHVVLSAGVLYDDGVTALIGNSPNLTTCHLYARVHVQSLDTGTTLNMRDFTMTLKRKFCNRKLFTGGDFHLSTMAHRALSNVWVQSNTDMTSLWSPVYHW